MLPFDCNSLIKEYAIYGMHIYVCMRVYIRYTYTYTHIYFAYMIYMYICMQYIYVYKTAYKKVPLVTSQS